MFMRTDRLFLRPIFPEDWREVYRGIADESIVRMLARAPWPYSEDDARAFCADAATGKRNRFAITVPGEVGAPIVGMIGFEPMDDAVNELGYWIGRNWQGRGFATEAVSGVLQIAEALGVDIMQAGHFIDNPASGKVLRKAGFVETGEIRPTASKGRGGEKTLARRYAKILRETAYSLQPAAA